MALLRRMNAKIYSVHKWLGLFCGVVLLVIGLTGSMLAFYEELDDWQFAHLRYVAAPAPATARVSLQSMLDAARASRPGVEILGIDVPGTDPRRTGTVYYEQAEDNYGAVFVNPYSGAVLGSITDTQSLSRILLTLHFTLFARPWGELVVALTGIGFLASGVTGLWVYRKNLLRPFRKGIRWRSGLKAMSQDAHTWFGVAAIAFNLVLGVSGVYLMLYAFSPGYLSGAETRAAEGRPKAHVALSADAYAAAAVKALPGFDVRSVFIPHHDGDPVFVNGQMPDTPFWLGGNGIPRSFVELDSRSGAVRAAQNINRAPRADRFEAVLYELHFGQYGGVAVKALYAVGGLTPGVLSLTGFVLWWKRRKRAASRLEAELRAKHDAARQKGSVGFLEV